MKSFRYSGYNRQGRPVGGSVEAPSVDEARDKLVKQGLFITKIKAAADERGGEVDRRPSRAPWTAHKRLNHLAEFSRQLAVLVSTGTPLVQALAAVERQAADPAWQRTVRSLRDRVEQGSSLADAMAENPADFDAVTRSLIAAGENAGNMPEMLKRLSSVTRQRQKTVKTVLGAMVYPSLLIVVSICVIMVMLVFVVPRFAGMFESLDAELPATTEMLLAIGAFLRSWWFVIFPAAALALGSLVLFLTTRRGRLLLDTLVLRLPVVGKVCKSLLLARIARMLGVLMGSHVKLLEALELTRQAAGNSHYRQLLVDAVEDVTAGEPLSSALGRSWLVSPAFAETVRNGEASGRLGDALGSLAEFMDEDNETAVKSLTSLIEPVILAVLGVVVGFVALSLFLPLFDLTAAAGGPK